MKKRLWQFIVKKVWPWLWPIIRDFSRENARTFLDWLKQKLSELVKEHSANQATSAADKAKSAQRKADESTSHSEKQAFAAEANAWRQVAEQLKAQNEDLLTRLNEILKESSKKADDVFAREPAKEDMEQKFLTLPEP